MAGPITWRTINGPSPAEASRPLALAQDAILGGFDRLGKAVTEQQAVNQGVIDRQEEARVQSFLDTIQRAQSPEQIAAMQASGELDALRASLSPKSLARVRGAEDTRADSVMKQITARSAFADQQLDREQAPIKDRILGFAANGEYDRALGELAQNPNLRNSAPIFQAIKEAERNGTKFNWESMRQQWAADQAEHLKAKRPLELEALENSNSNAVSQQAWTEEQRAELARQREAATAAARVAAEGQALKDTGNVYASEGVFDPKDTQGLMEMLTKAGIGDDVGERQAVIKRLSEIATQELDYVTKDGKIAKATIPVPKSLVTQAILGAEDGPSWWNQGYADGAEENLRKSVRQFYDTEFKDKNGKPLQQNQVVEDYFTFNEYLQRRTKNPPPASKVK